MYLFPRHNFEIESEMSPSEISNTIRLFSEKSRYLAIENKKHFVGKADDRGFSLTDSGYIENSSFVMRNSFAPVIRGKYISHDGGTTITIKASMHWAVQLFLIFLFCLLFFMVFLPLLFVDAIAAFSILGGATVVLYLFMIICFNLGMNSMDKKLKMLKKVIC